MDGQPISVAVTGPPPPAGRSRIRHPLPHPAPPWPGGPVAHGTRCRCRTGPTRVKPPAALFRGRPAPRPRAVVKRNYRPGGSCFLPRPRATVAGVNCRAAKQTGQNDPVVSRPRATVAGVNCRGRMARTGIILWPAPFSAAPGRFTPATPRQ